MLGATDRRVRAVVSQVPTIIGFEQGLRRVPLRTWRWPPTLEPKKLVTIQGDRFDPHLGQSEKSSTAAIGFVRGSLK
jgi:hypothetical protein